MNYEILLISEVENGIVQVTINREKALNALNRQTMLELNHFFGTTLPQNDEMKGVILTGAGPKAFVAGADIKEFLGLNKSQGAELAKYGQDTFFLIENNRKPVIAAINGFALGGGCELAMSCHLRVASDNAKFGQPEVNLGLIPGYGGTQRLTQLIGKTKSMELTLTAEIISAQDAFTLGLVNYVTAQEELIDKAKQLLTIILTKAPVAISEAIASINAFFKDGVDGFDAEIENFANCSSTNDFQEGATAFVEKRRANFKGN